MTAMRNLSFINRVKPAMFSFLEDDPAEFMDELQIKAEDLDRLRKILIQNGIDVGHPLCYAFWKRYSMQSSAGWLSIDDDEVLEEVSRVLYDS